VTHVTRECENLPDDHPAQGRCNVAITAVSRLDSDGEILQVRGPYFTLRHAPEPK